MSEQLRIRVLSVDDHPLLREGISPSSIANQTCALWAKPLPGAKLSNVFASFARHNPDGCQAPRYERHRRDDCHSQVNSQCPGHHADDVRRRRGNPAGA